MPADNPTLSLCVITRNEERNLPRCLASVTGLVDEIVVNDSGSTDATVALARQAGATVVPFEWCDDFSAAYNNCLDNASCDWILLLDADEELAPGSEELVRACVARPDAFAFTVLRQDYYGDVVKPEAQSEMLQLRLFRRRPDVRFRGRIHQQLEPSLSIAARAEGKAVLPSDVRIRHYGYMGDQPRQKLERSIRLLEIELRERPGQFYYLVELGRSRLAAGDPAGIENLRQAAEQVADGRIVNSAASPVLQLLIEQLLALPPQPDGFPLDDALVESMASEQYPDSIPVLWQLARRRFVAGEYERARMMLERIRELAKTGAYDKACSFDPVLIGADSALNLGVCLAHLGEIAAAIACLEEVADDPVRGPAARQNIEALRNLLNG